MKFDKLHLLLFVLLIGMVLYLAFCNEQDTLTKREGEALAEKSEEALNKLDSLFDRLELMDSIKIINNYYTTKYYNEKKTKDSLLLIHPELADSVFIALVKRLRSEHSSILKYPTGER